MRWQPLALNWKLETGNWKLETGNWKLETGNWQLTLVVPRGTSSSARRCSQSYVVFL
jgi:hypothetical protein